MVFKTQEELYIYIAKKTEQYQNCRAYIYCKERPSKEIFVKSTTMEQWVTIIVIAVVGIFVVVVVVVFVLQHTEKNSMTLIDCRRIHQSISDLH